MKFLFLDFDNTLMGTEQYGLPSLIDRFNQLYQSQIGRLLSLEEFKTHFHGQAREGLCDSLSQYFNINVEYPILFQDREWRMMQHYQSLPQGIPMAPNLIETLSMLRDQAFQFALVSNNLIQRAMTAMRFAHNQQGAILSQFFGTHFFEAGDVQKPKPDIYLRAIAQTNASPSHSYAVEDSITGAKAAIGAGLTTFGYTGFADDPLQAKAKLLETGCVAVFDNWKDFPDLINILKSA